MRRCWQLCKRKRAASFCCIVAGLTCQLGFCAWGCGRLRLRWQGPAASGLLASPSPTPRWTEKVKTKEIFSSILYILCHLFVVSKRIAISPSPSSQKLWPLCGCGRRNTSLWDRPLRSSPGRWPRTRGRRCKRCGRRRSSPSDPAWSPQPWCYPQSQARRRTLRRPPRCSDRWGGSVSEDPPGHTSWRS